MCSTARMHLQCLHAEATQPRHSGQFRRRLKTSLFRLAYGRDWTAYSWLSTMLQRRTTVQMYELNWPQDSRQQHPCISVPATNTNQVPDLPVWVRRNYDKIGQNICNRLAEVYRHSPCTTACRFRPTTVLVQNTGRKANPEQLNCRVFHSKCAYTPTTRSIVKTHR